MFIFPTQKGSVYRIKVFFSLVLDKIVLMLSEKWRIIDFWMWVGKYFQIQCANIFQGMGNRTQVFHGRTSFRLYVDGSTGNSSSSDGQQIRSELELHHHHVWADDEAGLPLLWWSHCTHNILKSSQLLWIIPTVPTTQFHGYITKSRPKASLRYMSANFSSTNMKYESNTLRLY